MKSDSVITFRVPGEFQAYLSKLSNQVGMKKGELIRRVLVYFFLLLGNEVEIPSLSELKKGLTNPKSLKKIDPVDVIKKLM